MASDFRNQQDLESWLWSRSKADAAVIGSRAALRCLPFVGRSYHVSEIDLKSATALTCAVFRAASWAWFVGGHPSQNGEQKRHDAFLSKWDEAFLTKLVIPGADMSSRVPSESQEIAYAVHAAIYAARAATSPVDAAANAAAAAAAAAYVLAVHRNAHGNAMALAGIARAGSARVGDHGTLITWDPIWFDASVLAKGLAPEELARRSLWPQGAPTWIQEQCDDFERSLRTVRDWEVWIDWYERRLNGTVLSEQAESVFADVAGKEWEKGYVAVNALIAERLATLEKPTQQRFQVFVSHAWQSSEIEKIVDDFIEMLNERLHALPPARKADYSVELWFDRENMPDTAATFNAATVAQCQKSNVALFLLSDRWYASAGCKAEAECFKISGAYDHDRILKIQVTGNFADGDPALVGGPVFPKIWNGRFATLTQLWAQGDAHQRDQFVTYTRDAICRRLEDLRSRGQASAAPLDRDELLRDVEALPQGSKVEIVNERAQIVFEGAEDDLAVATKPANQNAQARVRKRATDLLRGLAGHEEQWGLEGIVATVSDLAQVLGEPPAQIAENIFLIWDSLGALGAFLEADDQLRANPVGNRFPLDPDRRGALEQLLQSATAFGAKFPEFRKLDEDCRKRQPRNRSIQPESEVFDAAAKAGRVEPRTQAILERERAAGERGEGEAAAGQGAWFQGTVQKMVGGFIGAATPNVDGEGESAPEVRSFLVGNALPIREMFQELPSHHRATLRAVLEELERTGASAPSNSSLTPADSLRKRFADLSERESDVLDRLLAGKPNGTIAVELQISLRTVEAHRASIMRKTGASNLGELVRLAVEQG